MVVACFRFHPNSFRVRIIYLFTIFVLYTYFILYYTIYIELYGDVVAEIYVAGGIYNTI